MEEKSETFPSPSSSENCSDNGSVDLKVEERFFQDVQTRVNEAKFEGEIHISYQISNALLFISILSQPRMNETDAETIYCILDDQFIHSGNELKKLGWSGNCQIDVMKKYIIGFYQTDFSHSNSERKFWGFVHHKTIFSSFSA